MYSQIVRESQEAFHELMRNAGFYDILPTADSKDLMTTVLVTVLKLIML